MMSAIVLFDPLFKWSAAVSYTHLRAHETVLDLVCRLLLEKKKKQKYKKKKKKMSDGTESIHNIRGISVTHWLYTSEW